MTAPYMLYGRRIAISLADKLFAESDASLRISFTIDKRPEAAFNRAKLRVYNLSRDTQANAAQKKARVAIEAGYQDEMDLLFSGRVTEFDTQHGIDSICTLNCDDDGGASAKRIYASFGPKTRFGDVLDAAVKALGVGRGNVDDVLTSGNFRASLTEYPRGVVLAGTAIEELTRITHSAGYTWSIQDGQLHLLKPGKPTNKETVSLSPESGLIGHIEPTNNGGIKARCLLRPQLQCNGRVHIQSATTQGLYRLGQLRHQGDTHGNDWFSQFTAEAL